MSQEAELNGEPKSVDDAPLGPDERQIFGAEHVHRMLDHLREGDTVVVWKLDWAARTRLPTMSPNVAQPGIAPRMRSLG